MEFRFSSVSAGGVAASTGIAALIIGASLLSFGVVQAQNGSDATPSSGAPAAPAGDAPAADGASGEQPASPPQTFIARPSEILPLASTDLTLDVVDTGKHLIAVGDRGHILASNDGKSWAQVEVPVRAPLTAVSFVDENEGWAVGHDAEIVHTSDGGKTWTLQNYQPELEKALLGVLFTDKQHGFAVGAYGLFLKTDDGGGTWSDASADAITADGLHLFSIKKLGDGSLFVTGEQGTLGLSTDGGNSWKKLASPYEATLFNSVPFGARSALICGLRGNAFISQDVKAGGWKKVDTGTQASFFGCASVDDHTAVMVGLNGTILVTDLTSGAVHLIASPVDSSYSNAARFGASLVVVGESGIHSVPLQ
jgi:photosystem II stability/assembly factor-like uncharacterized protein